MHVAGDPPGSSALQHSTMGGGDIGSSQKISIIDVEARDTNPSVIVSETTTSSHSEHNSSSSSSSSSSSNEESSSIYTKNSSPWFNMADNNDAETSISQELDEALREVTDLSSLVDTQRSKASGDAATALLSRKRLLEEEISRTRSEVASLRSASNSQPQARDYHPPPQAADDNRVTLDEVANVIQWRDGGSALESVMKSLADAAKKISNLKSKNDTLTAKVVSLESKRSDAETMNVELLEKVKLLDQTMVDPQTINYVNEILKLKKEKEVLTTNNEVLTTKLWSSDHTRNQITEYEQLLDQAMNELKTLTNVNEDLVKSLEELSDGKDKALAQIQELETAIANKNHSGSEYVEQVQKLTSENKHLISRLNQASSHSSEWRDQLTQLKGQVAEYRFKSEERDEELSTLRAEQEARKQAEVGKPRLGFAFNISTYLCVPQEIAYGFFAHLFIL